MKLVKKLILAVACAAIGLSAPVAAQDKANEQFIAMLAYRTGPYAAGGSGIFGGFEDYLEQYLAAARKLEAAGYLVEEHMDELEAHAQSARPLFGGGKQ